MKAPINIKCPVCEATAGNYCTSMANTTVRSRVAFHHAERVDAAFRATSSRHDDSYPLREESVIRPAKQPIIHDDDDVLSFIITIHWLFKAEPALEEYHLCDVPSSEYKADHSIVLRPVIRQRTGGRLHECKHCAAIGRELGIP